MVAYAWNPRKWEAEEEGRRIQGTSRGQGLTPNCYSEEEHSSRTGGHQAVGSKSSSNTGHSGRDGFGLGRLGQQERTSEEKGGWGSKSTETSKPCPSKTARESWRREDASDPRPTPRAAAFSRETTERVSRTKLFRTRPGCFSQSDLYGRERETLSFRWVPQPDGPPSYIRHPPPWTVLTVKAPVRKCPKSFCSRCPRGRQTLQLKYVSYNGKLRSPTGTLCAPSSQTPRIYTKPQTSSGNPQSQT
ncbi:uncharacterized protein LOC117286274 [Fukomys damarensis]|uniref:uncharacterized protein LOC117286274 n=1 Tax=Fukomys damarensis TaxID=885580 RepID=UPI001454F52F|nr:uncharacterized protein LOC117286274 [Fukomys damarensis]